MASFESSWWNAVIFVLTIGGLLGLLTVVVALPRTMKGRVQLPKGVGRRADRLVPTTEIGRRRVFRMYLALSVACFVAYLATGMRVRSAAIHAMTTVSTGHRRRVHTHPFGAAV